MVDELEQSTEFAQYFNDEAYKYFRHSFSQKAPEGESYADVLYRVEQFFKMRYKRKMIILLLWHIKSLFVVSLFILVMNLKRVPLIQK